MNNEFIKPNIERQEPGVEREDLLGEVVPNQDQIGQNRHETQTPIHPFELPETDGTEPEYHEEIPGHPLKAKLSEDEKVREVNKMISGHFDDPSDVTEFLSNQMEG